jgi:MYXO-CTERM domain-containing protein
MIRLSGFILGAFLCGGCLQASTAWSVPTGAQDSANEAVAGYANFYLSDCVTGPTSSCTLNIAITNTEANATSAGQLISGLSFQLLNAGTSLPATGTLSDAINNNSNGNGTGGAVTVRNNDGSTTTTTATPDRWDLGAGGGGFYLTTLSGSKPRYLIMADGADSNANASIYQHSPSLVGTVDFEITDIVGLTTSTVLSNVKFYFGTGPETTLSGVCTADCGTITTTGATPPSVPEPFSLMLAGSGLLALGLLRRRSA